MWRVIRTHWLTGLLTFCAVAVQANPSAPVRLTAPEPGAMLAAGSTVTIAWEQLETGFVGLEGPVEEWEAFLSVDGGRTWPFRVTPHLDLDLSTFSMIVPPVVSDNVRILLRFGDERREVGFEMPQRFSIVKASPASFLAQLSAVALPGIGRGEAARAGERGVLSWVEGSRRGQDLRWRTAAGSSQVRDVRIVAGSLLLPLLPPARRQETGLSELAAAASGQGLVAASGRTIFHSVARSVATLLLIQRSNE